MRTHSVPLWPRATYWLSPPILCSYAPYGNCPDPVPRQYFIKANDLWPTYLSVTRSWARAPATHNRAKPQSSSIYIKFSILPASKYILYDGISEHAFFNAFVSLFSSSLFFSCLYAIHAHDQLLQKYKKVSIFIFLVYLASRSKMIGYINMQSVSILDRSRLLKVESPMRDKTRFLGPAGILKTIIIVWNKQKNTVFDTDTQLSLMIAI